MSDDAALREKAKTLGLDDSYGQTEAIYEALLSVRDEALEECLKLSKEVSQEEVERAQDYRGVMVFQSQSYIDGAVEVEERIRALKSRGEDK